MSKKKSLYIWIAAFILTIFFAAWQRMTGPTYPARGSVRIAGEEIKYKLPRSHEVNSNQIITVEVPDKTIWGELAYKRYPSHDEWTRTPMARQGDELKGELPAQPAAGKIMYNIDLKAPSGEIKAVSDEPIITRFKGVVPWWVLIPHILIMFVAMLWSTRAGLGAFFRDDKLFMHAVITAVLLFIGGVVLGPIVQKYAFDAYWTGWPVGNDLTDNKTALSIIMWIVAAVQLKKHPERKRWAVIAAIVLVAVYLIPHSVLGSEIDYTQRP
ncbi:MAG: hypothetical protein ACM3U1_10785 [Chloroflexota bacterium]